MYLDWSLLHTIKKLELNRRALYLILLLILCINVITNAQEPLYQLGEDQILTKDFDSLYQAESYDSLFIRCDRIINGEHDPQLKAVAYYYKARTEEILGQIIVAEESYEHASKLFIGNGFKEELSIVYLGQAELCERLEYDEKCDSLLDLCISYSGELKQYNALVIAHQMKALLFYDKLETNKANMHLNEALKAAKAIGDDEKQVSLINQISTNYHSLGKLDSAIFYFQKSLKLKHTIKDTEGLIGDYSALGNLFRERGDYELAQEQLMKALEIAEEELDSFSITTIYSELGDIYAAQNIWNVSEDYYEKASYLARQKNSRFMEAGCLKKLGKLYLQQKKDSIAVVVFETALDLYSQLKNKVNEAEVLVYLSQIYKDEKQFDKIKILLEQSLEASSRSQDVMSSLFTKLALADIELKLGNFNTGIKYAEDCLESFREMEDRENIKQASLLLSDAYSKRGDFKNAYQYLIDYSKLKDELNSVERAEAIKKYDLLATTKKKDEEIAEQDKMIQDQQVSLLRKNNQVLLLAGGIGFLALVAGLIMFVYFKNKQLNQQRIRVLEKEQETDRLKAIIEGEEKERKRLSRELHDGLGAVLATVKMQISSVSHKFPAIQSSSDYQKAESLIDDACQTVREVSHDLMPHVLEQQGLMSAIEDMCQNIANHRKIEFDFIPYGNEDELSDVLKITIYRITQELLKNITKHAEATEVIVQLTIEDDEVILIVEDNGKGFDPSVSKKGIGIENIQSRTAYLNGKVEVDSTIDQGSNFLIQIPINRKNE